MANLVYSASTAIVIAFMLIFLAIQQIQIHELVQQVSHLQTKHVTPNRHMLATTNMFGNDHLLVESVYTAALSTTELTAGSLQAPVGNIASLTAAQLSAAGFTTNSLTTTSLSAVGTITASTLLAASISTSGSLSAVGITTSGDCFINGAVNANSLSTSAAITTAAYITQQASPVMSLIRTAASIGGPQVASTVWLDQWTVVRAQGEIALGVGPSGTANTLVQIQVSGYYQFFYQIHAAPTSQITMIYLYFSDTGTGSRFAVSQAAVGDGAWIVGSYMRYCDVGLSAGVALYYGTVAQTADATNQVNTLIVYRLY
eukprot:TRINITY_DN12912_c0_g1_i1.p1 TRINITY_DN12912_c0_g1~~TRINITY_DN12912_c0_g1_i1.p1  ORF type:complete len:315 (-),score=56.42 TRINITY_DN12912_c0_g1_i1:58-1002(-)